MPPKPQPSLRPQDWLVQRLQSIARYDPRFEASWYGPYNALLSHYFPYQQRFLIKPQPKIRDSVAEEADISFSSVQAESSVELDGLPDEDSFDAADLSITSMGNAVLPSAGPAYIPDFIVTKATQFATHDTPLLVVEVKVDVPTKESEWVSHQTQMDKYMDSLSAQMSGGTRLIGLLICDTKVKTFRSEGPGSGVNMDETTYSINSKSVRKLLLEIATDNWDY